MHELSLKRDHILAVVDQTLQQLAGDAVKAGESGDSETAERLLSVAAEVDKAREWALTVEPEKADDLDPGASYTSSNGVISLIQSAVDAYAEEEPVAADVAAASPYWNIAGYPEAPDDAEVRIARYVHARLQSLFEPKARFRYHADSDVRRDRTEFALPAQGKVALVADWGTGLAGAARVANWIRVSDPDYVIHLGDVYHTGEEREVQKNFIWVWRNHGPDRAQYLALNGNHDMMSEGRGYFGTVLDFCGQDTSYFVVQNEHWSLLGLDTAYKDHDLFDKAEDWRVEGQHAWLRRRLADGTSRKILLTHHQPVSAVDDRPAKERLRETMEEHFDLGRVFAWFFGHEHRLLVYEDPSQFHGIRLRCIGHGGQRGKAPDKPMFDGNVFKVRRFDAVRSDDSTTLANGFALLTFDGPQLEVDYIDEFGRTWDYRDVWP